MGQRTGVLQLAGNAFKSQILLQLTPNTAGEMAGKEKRKSERGGRQKEKESAALIRNGNETDEKQAHFRAATQMVPPEHASATRVSMP